MKRLLCPALIILAVVVTACSVNTKDRETPPTQITFTDYAEAVGDSFTIDIQLPEGYTDNPQERYPTLVLTDGNFYFPMMAAVVKQYQAGGLLKPVILISVGYKSLQRMDSLRVRDYLYPKALPSDEMNAPGGGENFYRYITTELLPEVDARFRTDTHDRTLLGHSFGGYFVLYALSRQLTDTAGTFKNFVSASPSLWYNDFYLNRLPEQLAGSERPVGICMTVGALEDSAWYVKPVKTLAAEIQRRNVKGLTFKSYVYSDLDHMDVAVLSFTKGLQQLLAPEER